MESLVNSQCLTIFQMDCMSYHVLTYIISFKMNLHIMNSCLFQLKIIESTLMKS